VVRIIPVLFIDDNVELCTLFQMFLEEKGDFSVHICNSGDEALLYLQDNKVMAVISDYDMPEMNGIDLLNQIRTIHPRLPFIMLTGNDSKETAIAALNAGADFYQNKGDDFEVQVLSLSHKIQVLASRHEAEESARKKGEILAAISYAAERLLQGKGWQEDMQEVLGHLGKATGASSVFITAYDRSLDFDSDSDAVIWNVEFNDNGAVSSDIYTAFHSWWKNQSRITLFASHQEIMTWVHTLPIEERQIFNAAHIGTFLLIPVYVDMHMWGVLGITDTQDGRIFSPEEVSALRMAAGVIGSARHRMYIEEFFRNPVEESLVGVFLMKDSRFSYVNPRFCEIFGYVRDEADCAFLPEYLVHPTCRDRFLSNIESVLHGIRSSCHFEFAGIRTDGTKIYLEMYLAPIMCGGFSCLVGNIMDVTERYQAKLALLESEERFRELFTNINDLILLHLPADEGGLILETNLAVSSSLLYDRSEMLSKNLPSLCPIGVEQDVCVEHIHVAADKGQSISRTVFLRNDGFAIPVEVSTRRVVMHGRQVLLTVARDITERVRADAKIRAGEELLKRNMLVSLREKETLLREIHHRVKNNMQIIISLLKLQEYQTEDTHVHEIIRDCRGRIYSMAVIHEKLYQTDELISIRLDEYFRDIADRVISEFESGNVHITLSITGSSDIFVDINTGIPLGLIMNELITNCMKYAFCPGQTGEIRIDLCKDGEFLTISVIDTGKGFPHDGIRMSDSSLGFELIKGLSLQLQGTVEWKNSGGACCMVTIPFAKTDNNEVSCQKVVEY